MNNLINIGIGLGSLIVTGITSYWFYRRSTGVKGEKIKNARKEVVNVLLNELVRSTQDIKPSVVEALLNNKYRDSGINPLAINELPLIIDDLITNIAGDIFIPPRKKDDFVQKVLRLKQCFDKREINLEQAIANWKKSSIFLISIGSAFTFFIGIAFGLATLIIFVILVPSTQLVVVIQTLWLIGLISALFGYMQYRIMHVKRNKNSKSLNIVLEHIAIAALRKIIPNATINKHVRINIDNRLAEVDLILVLNENKLPVEIKHRNIQPQTIMQIESVMNIVNARRGLLIMTSVVSNKVKKLAREKGIIVLDQVTSENEIVDYLKDTELF